MKALVTGGAGFVGRRFVRRLSAEDHEIVIVDNLVSGIHPADWYLPHYDQAKLQFHFADMRQFIHGLNPKDFDLVIHCAAVVGGRLMIENDPLAVATDLSIDAELFNWIVRGKKRPHLIYFSSSAVYPIELQVERCHCALAEDLVTFDKTRIGMPDMTYGFAKLAGEYLAGFAKAKYDLPVTIYRPFSGYGEDQDLSYPFPALVKRIVDGENPVTVWGSGNQIRDWIYVEDIVSCVLQTWQQGGVLNIGTGHGMSFAGLLSAMRDVLNADFDITPDPTKPEGVFHRVADVCKMEQHFKPQIPLRSGIKKVAAALLTRGKQA